jgi:hypothetical protein
MRGAASVLARLLVIGVAVASASGPALAKGSPPPPPKTPKPKPPTAPKPKSDPSSSSGVVKPKECVELEPTWDGAVALAKAMNVPIVLHAHAFASAASWDMHDNVMCSKEYREFEVDNGVDVIVLRGIDDGVANKDPRAATYEGKRADGSKVRYLAELPGLTVADLDALEATKAASYNSSGQAPYTALIDPWDLVAGQQWTADVGITVMMDAITKAKGVLEKQHGRADKRADVKALFAAIADADAKMAKADFSAAVSGMNALEASKANASERYKKSCDDEVAKVVGEAQKALDAIAARKGSDVLGARKDLALLIPKLKGTGLENKASALMDSLK